VDMMMKKAYGPFGLWRSLFIFISWFVVAYRKFLDITYITASYLIPVLFTISWHVCTITNIHKQRYQI